MAIFYCSCSSKCYSCHKKQGCEISLTIVKHFNKQISNSPHITEDTVSIEKLQLLDTSNELKTILRNQHLKKLLYNIDGSSNPSDIMQKMMKEPIFVEFADTCLKIVEDVTEC
ncbi:uncharacterized protein CBL_13549 [Carabus blaptoides fortunei]